MPLLDHFHPPLSKQRHWDSFHGAWAEAIATHLNEDLLPPRYVAEARVKIGSRVEIDVSTFEEGAGQATAEDGGVAVWAPPKATAIGTLEFGELDLIEINILNDEEGPKVVSAIELVSPANKNRPAHRKAFSVKCASYLQEDISLMIVDVVTDRRGNLHAGLLEFLNLSIVVPPQGPGDLYAAVYRSRPGTPEGHLEIWSETLAVGAALPTLPLWLGPDLALPLNLEQTYLSACSARRIELP